MGFSLTHIIFAAIVILLLFGGRGKISEIMGDFAKGIKSFKKGMSEDEESASPPPQAQPVETLRAEAPIVIEHQREVEVPGGPAAKPRARAAAKPAAKTAAKTTAKAPAKSTAKATASKKTTTRKKSG